MINSYMNELSTYKNNTLCFFFIIYNVIDIQKNNATDCINAMVWQCGGNCVILPLGTKTKL